VNVTAAARPPNASLHGEVVNVSPPSLDRNTAPAHTKIHCRGGQWLRAIHDDARRSWLALCNTHWAEWRVHVRSTHVQFRQCGWCLLLTSLADRGHACTTKRQTATALVHGCTHACARRDCGTCTVSMAKEWPRSGQAAATQLHDLVVHVTWSARAHESFLRLRFTSEQQACTRMQQCMLVRGFTLTHVRGEHDWTC
jgi:hypothetical protein